MPAFSASARTTVSKASANLRMAYCSSPGQVYREKTRGGAKYVVEAAEDEDKGSARQGVKEGMNSRPCATVVCLPLNNL